jgi:hypothetical protein
MDLRGVGLSCVVIITGCAGSALADELILVKGQVTAESGPDIIFDSLGSKLVGQSFNIQYQVFDTDPQYLPFAQTFDAPYSSSVSGGYDNGTSPVFASVTIGGLTFDDSDLWTNGEAMRTAPPSGRSEVSYSAEDADWGSGDVKVWTTISSTTDAFVTNPNYETTLFHSVQSDDLATGGLTETYFDASGLEAATLTLTPTSISIFGFADPAPEPMAWTMLLVGFGAVGATARRRRSAAA